MARDGDTNELERDLTAAIDDLQEALERAGQATQALRALAPRLAAAGGVLREIEALVQAGRQQLRDEPAQPAAYTRPTLVVPSQPAQQTPVLDPATPEPSGPSLEEQRPVWPSQPEEPRPPEQQESPEPAPERPETPQISFRLTFESDPGPLDLRAVDEAVSEHPAVRDVALLDYDGRRATLKVWIAADASPAEIQDSLRQRDTARFGHGQQVTIVALEDAA